MFISRDVLYPEILEWPVTGEVGWWFRTLESGKVLGSIPYCALSGRVPRTR